MIRLSQNGPMNACEFLPRTAAGMALPALGDPWEDLVSSLGCALRVDWAFLGHLSSDQDVVRTWAAWHRGKMVPNFAYRFERIPEDDDALSRDIWFYSNSVQERLPNAWLKKVRAQAFGRASLLDSLGHTRAILAVAHTQPLEPANLVEAVLRMFALRAATELERGLPDEYLIRELRVTTQ